MIFWEKDIETLQRSGIHKLQVEKLNQTITIAQNSLYYDKLFKQKGIKPGTIKNIEEITKLPFTTKQDLRDHFPYGFLTVDRRDVVRLHSSSGTTGNPTVIFHTASDLKNWANLVARSLFTAGIRDTDVFQNICGYGLFTGGLGFQYGIERLGCLSIPAGAGNSLRQIKLMQDYGTTAAHAIPSYLNRLYDVFKELNLDPKRDTQLHTFVIGAEPHTEEQRRRIEEMFGVKAYNSFGLSEMNGPGVAFECTFQNGLHIWEDAFIVEIVDPETLEPVPHGEVGELVMTTLDRIAMPLIRYRTRDLTRFLPGDCPCGRTHYRLDRITGRTDDMFIVKGCNIFPMQIEGVLMKIPEAGSNYLITIENINDNDELIIQVEVKREWFSGDLAKLDNLTRLMAHKVRDEVLVKPIIKLVEPGSLPQSEGKAVRVIDKRKIL
ncbi:MAG: phenylacetate--CoA ligase [Bacteroidetes bacterium GWF2_42_66]|nr:MAG: phenylacetate--CoA ligase [Bacteroidetes bacterium GWA2_42_15]OFX99702.1 MAG: phenylacetate--CoA ligase [Bacteroidetes bacterium GWE2_42_39]OFY39740.1 MAG: phenylacetate--CoA ligase [Bacteroidetes bacterium GWF2_42_66]HAZ02582.1 phenylacetate--CoA ligase [Marinilabiliales bacterium]HBL74843.1 phenylacetate--CoA ligase [Prolixibacteraceae bacterium]